MRCPAREYANVTWSAGFPTGYSRTYCDVVDIESIRAGPVDVRIRQAHGDTMTATRAGVRSSCIGLVLVALLAAGCAVVQSQALLATLPTSAGGVDFDTPRMIDDSFMSGHPVDDVLTALGKRRSDATIVERVSWVGEGDIGALVVYGVSGEVLLNTVVQTWRAAAVVGRAQTRIGDRDVWALDFRGGGQVFLAYQRGSTVYWASTGDRSLAEQFIAAMP